MDAFVHESDDFGRAHPWLTLSADDSTGRPSVFRNLTLTGSPDVPRAVPLLETKAIRWNTSPSIPLGSHFNLANPNRFTSDDDDTTFYYAPPPRPEAPRPAWSVKEDRLIADRLQVPGQFPLPSRLDYDRPFSSGDSVRYEFLYEPGATMVQPALGRVIFALGPDGVQIHGPDWGEDGWAGSGDHAHPAPGRQLGPEKPPLKPGGWNGRGCA